MIISNALNRLTPIVFDRGQNDAYKGSMRRAYEVEGAFNGVQVIFRLIDRAWERMPAEFFQEFRRQVNYVAEVPANRPLADFMIKQWDFIPEDFWLRLFVDFKFDPQHVHVNHIDGLPDITVQSDIRDDASMWELPLVHIYTALKHIFLGRKAQPGHVAKSVATGKYFMENGVISSLMAGRRVPSQQALDEVAEALAQFRQCEPNGPGISGYSWWRNALLNNMRPMGSVAHEFYMICGALFGYKNANRMAMDIWERVFGKNLGYALPDTFRYRTFYQDLSYAYAKDIHAYRLDSKANNLALDELLAHLYHIKVDPRTNLAVFSNNRIDEEKLVVEMNQYRRGEIMRAFGMGRIYVSGGIPDSDVVCKPIAIIKPNGQRVGCVKLSEEPGKEFGDPKDIAECKAAFGIVD